MRNPEGIHCPQVRGAVEDHWSDQGGPWNDTPGFALCSFTRDTNGPEKGHLYSGLLKFPVFVKSLPLSKCFGWVWGRDPHWLDWGRGRRVGRCREGASDPPSCRVWLGAHTIASNSTEIRIGLFLGFIAQLTISH